MNLPKTNIPKAFSFGFTMLRETLISKGLSPKEVDEIMEDDVPFLFRHAFDSYNELAKLTVDLLLKNQAADLTNDKSVV